MDRCLPRHSRKGAHNRSCRRRGCWPSTRRDGRRCALCRLLFLGLMLFGLQRLGLFLLGLLLLLRLLGLSSHRRLPLLRLTLAGDGCRRLPIPLTWESLGALRQLPGLGFQLTRLFRLNHLWRWGTAPAGQTGSWRRRFSHADVRWRCRRCPIPCRGGHRGRCLRHRGYLR